MENFELWRKALVDYRHKINMPYREIAERANLSEKGVARIFTGEAKTPGIDVIRKILEAMGASAREIFGESSAVITTEDIDKLKADNIRLTNENNALIAENLVLTSKLKEAEANNTILQIKLEYEQKITALHSYYTQSKDENKKEG